MVSPGMIISERYEIIDKVGSGGMANVYKAKDRRLNRFVAIKILKQEYSNDAKFVAKFRAEAQSVAGLSHPNIVNVYDVGEDGALYYIVMELVEGITLKKFIEKKGRLDVKEAVGIGIQIAQGMEEAHSNHIIHRDIKPQNIIISKEGKVKVTDFGIAKAATSNTITSNAMGSVHYISPEQARGGYSDEKSDIYSLGVTIYEMVSGKVPFEGESTVTVALAHIQEEAETLESIDPEIPHSLSMVVQKCMQKKPDMRYPTAAALISDLKRSLIEPDGDFVFYEPQNYDSSPTIMISDAELGDIKEAARPAPDGLAADGETDDAIDPKLEKILKACSVVVAIIIIAVILLIIGKVGGWWGGPKDDAGSSADTSLAGSPMPSGESLVMVEVPDIVEMTLEDATAHLRDSNLKWRLQTVDSDAKANTVTDQDPAAGEEVEEYSIVTIYYSRNNTDVTIPNLVGYSPEEAMTALEDLGLTVAGQTEAYSDSVPEGQVCATDPVIGSGVERDSAVTIIVSKGPESKMTTVPNIVGRKESVALQRLEDKGLKGNTGNVSYIYSDKYAYGIVVSQSVANGTSVEIGTVIDYSVSLGPKQESTPKPTQRPTPEPSYSYVGSVTISGNPFDYEGESADIKLVLSQDGQKKTVWEGVLGYDDFPRKFDISGWSENNGTIILYKDDVATGNTYNIEFKRVRE